MVDLITQHPVAFDSLLSGNEEDVCTYYIEHWLALGKHTALHFGS